MVRRFRALRIVSVIFKVFAWIALISGVLAAIGVIFGGVAGITFVTGIGDTAIPGGFLVVIGAAIAMLLGAFVYFVMLYASSEAIELALAIEENTREVSYYLRNHPPSTRGG